MCWVLTWLFGSVRYRTTIGTRYLEKAAGKLGRLSCKNMAMLGTCSISSARTVGSEWMQHEVKHKMCASTSTSDYKWCVWTHGWMEEQFHKSTTVKNSRTEYIAQKRHLPPSSDILATVSMTLMKSFSLSLNSRSTSSRPRATICLESKRSSKSAECQYLQDLSNTSHKYFGTT